MITPKENIDHMYRHKKIERLPEPGEGEQGIYPVSGFLERPPHNLGGKDWFHCSWEYSESAGAPAPDIDKHLLADICDWEEIVKFPDLDAWDWKKAVETDHVSELDREHHIINLIVCTGLFERLHVLMGFENALCALVTDIEAVEAFFDRMTEYKMQLIDKLHQYYRPDFITFHDDWGTQKALFFSPELWKRLLYPRMKKIIAHAHSYGIGFIMHSCGKIDDIAGDICEMGVDTLQCMDINDIGKILAETKGRMSVQASVHTQDFEAKDKAGILTEELVRKTVRKEFMDWGATGRYFPFLLPPDTWYEKIILEEYMKCREELRGTFKK